MLHILKIISNLIILSILDLHTHFIKQQSILLSNHTNNKFLFSNNNINEDYIIGFQIYLNILSYFKLL